MISDDETLELALKASNEGIWDWNLATGEIDYSNRLLGFLRYGKVGAPNLFLEPELHVHPDDLSNFKAKLDRVRFRNGKLFATESRIRTRDGDWKWFRVRGVPVFNSQGQLIRMVGSFIDISKRRTTQLQLAEERNRITLVLEKVPVNVYFKDRESRFVKANIATAKRMGVQSVDELIGKTDHDFFQAEHADHSQAEERLIMETGMGHEEKLTHEVWDDGTESWVLVTKKIWKSRNGEVLGTFGITHDVSELIKKQNELIEVANELTVVNREITEEQHLLRMVIDNIPAFVFFKDQDSRFVLVNRGMAHLLGAGSPSEMVGKSDSHYFPAKDSDGYRQDEIEIMASGVPMVSKIEKRQAIGQKATWSVTSKYPWYHTKGGLRGTFGVSLDVTRLVDLKLQLEKITRILEKQNQGLESQLNLAREIQQAAFTPVIPPIVHHGKKVGFHHYYKPASKLAGDFYEIFPMGNGLGGFLICDVMGHGVRASLIVSMVRGLSEKQRATVGADPGAFLTGLNEGLTHLLERTSQLIFTSAIFGVVDLEKNEVRLASAGHPSPIVKRHDRVEVLPLSGAAKGPALGMVEGFQFEAISLPLDTLQGLWVFTDGIFEVLDPNGNELGLLGMCEALEAAKSGKSAINQLLDAAMNFAGGKPFDDDLCILGLDFTQG